MEDSSLSILDRLTASIESLRALIRRPGYPTSVFKEAYDIHCTLVDSLGEGCITYEEYKLFTGQLCYYEALAHRRIIIAGNSCIDVPSIVIDHGLSKKEREMYLADAKKYLRSRKGISTDNSVLNVLINIANSNSASVEEQLRCVEIMKELRGRPPMTWMNRELQRFGHGWI